MTKDYRAVPADEVFAAFSPERQKKVNARAVELVAEEFARIPRKQRLAARKKITRNPAKRI